MLPLLVFDAIEGDGSYPFSTAFLNLYISLYIMPGTEFAKFYIYSLFNAIFNFGSTFPNLFAFCTIKCVPVVYFLRNCPRRIIIMKLHQLRIVVLDNLRKEH